MVSEYEYIDVDDLEAKTGKDYESINAALTDDVVYANITLAERFVNSQLTEIPSEATDGMIVATTLLAERFMHNLLVQIERASPIADNPQQFVDYIVQLALRKSEYSPVDSIPMQGIDRY